MSRISWWVAIGLMIGASAASAILYPQLPDRVPIHWDIRGRIDGYGAKGWAAFLTPAIMVGLLGLFAILPRASPKQFRIDAFRSTYDFVVALTMGLLAYIHGLTLWAALGHSLDFGRSMMGGMFLFFILIGNVLGKVRRNFWVGIRVPWTLASDRVWNETHRMAAWIFVASGVIGLLMIAAGLTLSSLLLIGVVAIAPIVYSFVIWKRLERRGEA